MPRINVSDKSAKWQWTCPTPYEHTDWRVVDGLFECRSCGETFGGLRNQKTGKRVPRDDIEIVGAGADHKGAFGTPTVRGGENE